MAGIAVVAIACYVLDEHTLKSLFARRAIPFWIAGIIAGPFLHAWLWYHVWDTLGRRELVVREINAIVELAQANPQEKHHAQELIERAQGHYSFEACTAAVAIGKIGDAAIPVIDQLAELMFSTDKYVAREASRSLRELGPRSLSVISQLEDRVANGVPSDSAWFAAEAIGNLGKDAQRSLPVLRSRLGASPVLDEYLLDAIEAIEGDR